MNDTTFDIKTTRDAFFDKVWCGANTSDKILVVAEYDLNLMKKILT